jgi:hypothetical protein
MDTEISTKINLLLQKHPSGALCFASWLNENGISYTLQQHYRDAQYPGAVIEVNA